MGSVFLPKDFDGSQPVAILAGKGLYPQLLAERILAANVPLRIVGFEGETEHILLERVPAEHRVVIQVGQIGKMLRSLERFGARSVIMAGQITPKKLFKGMQPDLKAILLLTKLKERNAETIFGGIAVEIEKLGIRVLDARSFMDVDLATSGIMVGKSLHPTDLVFGIHIAREIARLDIGQGVVVNRGTVLAVEAFEGTNAMLQRVRQFEAKHPLFVKTVKLNQDYRFDVPVFGMHTLDVMRTNGIRSAALQAGSTLILDKAAVLEQAKKEGMNLIGYI